MFEQKKLIVSHAPFWHIGNRVTERSYHTMLAALPAVLAGLVYFGVPVIGVVGLSVATAMLWELLINKVMKKSPTIGDGNAALIGLLLAMVFPATMPWWAVVTGTFIAVVIGKQIFGGIGSNAFNPVALAEESGFSLLDFSAQAALCLKDISFHHRDLFDRMLIAQSITENYPIMTEDPKIALYSCRVI